MIYQLIKSPFDDSCQVVKNLENNTYIPLHESNADYQAYLKWVAEGNTPEPADE